MGFIAALLEINVYASLPYLTPQSVTSPPFNLVFCCQWWRLLPAVL